MYKVQSIGNESDGFYAKILSQIPKPTKEEEKEEERAYYRELSLQRSGKVNW